MSSSQTCRRQWCASHGSDVCEELFLTKVVVALQELLRLNIEANRAAVQAGGGSVQETPLVWGQTQRGDLPEEWREPDLVVAADVVYRRELFEPLLAAMLDLGAGTGSRAYLHSDCTYDTVCFRLNGK